MTQVIDQETKEMYLKKAEREVRGHLNKLGLRGELYVGPSRDRLPTENEGFQLGMSGYITMEVRLGDLPCSSYLFYLKYGWDGEEMQLPVGILTAEGKLLFPLDPTRYEDLTQDEFKGIG